jgi:hypothetical protein
LSIHVVFPDADTLLSCGDPPVTVCRRLEQLPKIVAKLGARRGERLYNCFKL